MKKVFLFNISAMIVLHIIIPIILYGVFGFKYEYASVDIKYVYLSSVLLTSVLLFVAFYIGIFRRNDTEIELEDLYESSYLQGKATEYLFVIALVINLSNVIKTGSFESLLGGSSNGTVIAYLQLFLDIRVLYFCVLLKAYRKKSVRRVLLWSFLYVMMTLMYFSRSGILWMILFNFWIIYGIDIPQNIKKRVLLIICCAVIIAPILFMYATNSRSNQKFSTDYIVQKIVARISFDEIAGIEMEQYLEGSYDKELFDRKYGVLNQAEQIVNAVVPGDIFENDIQPNQYWRAIFSTWSESTCKLYYMSMPSILPLYLIIKYGFALGIFLTITILIGIYSLIRKMRDPMVCIFLTGIVFYTVFQFFDWVYHFQDLFSFFLTFLMIKLMSRFTSRVRIGKYKL